MSDTIYRDDAIKAINLRVRIPHDVVSAQYASIAINAIRSVPSADRPQGEWIAKTENYHSHWVCSECGAWALLEYNEQMCLSNFCPNCGARMKGADDE